MALRKTFSTNKANKKAGGCGLLGFGIVWTLFSSIFFILGLYSIYEGLGRSQWPEVSCEVTQFKIPSNKPNADPQFQPKVKYRYNWEGTTYHGDKVWPNKDGEEKFEDLAEIFEHYRDGKLTKCYVNPDLPTESVLVVSSSDIWNGLVPTLVGGGFMAIGFGMIIMGRREKKNKTSALSSKSTEDEAPAAILVPFCSIFALAGFGILIFVVFPAGQKYFAAKSWQETPAKVIWSKVRSHDGDDSTTYSVDIFYRYTFNDRVYRSNTAGLMSSSSSGRSSKQKVVKAHPRGTEIICYVNPEKPWQALRKRDLGWSALFALFPLPFIAIGVGGLWWLANKRKKNLHLKNSYHHTQSNKNFSSSVNNRKNYIKPQTEFTPRRSRIKKFIGVSLFTAFWCGITSVFVVIAVKSWLNNNPEWFLTIFITPFVLVGIGGILYTTYNFLTLFSPAPVIKLKPSAISMDGSAKINWHTTGGIGSIGQLSIYLVGEEEATYRQGTDTKTANEVFHEEVIVETSDPRKIARGSAPIDLSTSSTPIIPSWKGTHNQIKWSLIVVGKIGFWPDIQDNYEIDILPIDINQ